VRFFLDAAAGTIRAIDTVDPARHFVEYRENNWAAMT